jgi:beta-glucosidase
VAGDEVAQVYLDKPVHPPAGVQFADDILAGFERVTLGPGESKQVVIHVPRRQLEYWSTPQGQWLTVPADADVVGGWVLTRPQVGGFGFRCSKAAE